MIVTGIVSGDHECWCLLVDARTFKEVKGEGPTWPDVGPFARKGCPYRYRLYPNDLIREFSRKNGALVWNFKGKLVALSMEAAILPEIKAPRKCRR
jgi:hypothetical protein